MKKLLLLIFLVSCSPRQEFTIGSGSPGAVYYPAAKALCKNFNKNDAQYKCVALTSKGAQKNMDNLASKTIDFGISQATLQYENYQRGVKNIRSVMGLHHEHFSIIVANGSKVRTFDDLKGKRVNIGNPGSGSRIYFERLMKLKGWKKSDFAEIFERKSSGLPDLICNDKADAAIYLVGHPNKIFTKMINKCAAKLIALSAKEQKSFKQILPDFKNTKILAHYKGQQENIASLGVSVILSTHKDVDSEIVTRMRKYSKENKIKLEGYNVIFREIDFSLPETKAPVF